MSQTLVLEVPDDVFETLKSAADGQGQSPESAGAEWLAQMAKCMEEDPLDKWIGAFRSDMPGWSLRHHELLGDALLRDGSSGGDKPQA